MRPRSRSAPRALAFRVAAVAAIAQVERFILGPALDAPEFHGTCESVFHLVCGSSPFRVPAIEPQCGAFCKSGGGELPRDRSDAARPLGRLAPELDPARNFGARILGDR